MVCGGGRASDESEIRHMITSTPGREHCRGSMLLKDLGVSENDANELVNDFQQNDYALVRAGNAQAEKQ